MRHILTTICILIFAFAPQHQAHSQETDTQKLINEVQDLAEWAESYFAILNNMVLLFSNDEINAAVAAVDTNDTDTIREAMIKYGQNRQLLLNNIEKSIDNIKPVPELKVMKKSQGRRVRKHIESMETQLKLLPVLYDEIAVASGHMETLLSRISKGDYSGVSEIGRQQNLALIRFMEAENLQAKAALLALEDDNPNHAFQSIVVAQNKIGIEELRIANLSMDSDVDAQERQSYNTKIKAELDSIPKFLAKGRAGQLKMSLSMKKAIPRMKTAQEKSFIKSAIAVVETFSETFNTEEKMYTLSLDSYGHYMSDKSNWEIEEPILENDEKIAELALERSRIMDKRVSLMKR